MDPLPASTAKVSYGRELRMLPSTYARALTEPIEALRECVYEIGGSPAAYIGSGGARALAILSARLHEAAFRQPASALTSLEALDSPRLADRAAVLFSSSGKHPDAHRVMNAFRVGQFFPAAVVTHRSAGDLEALTGPNVRIVSLGALPQRDGFLATGSILQTATLLIRAYLPSPVLPDALPEVGGGVLVRDELLILTPPSLACVAADLEIRLVESGLASVQVADYRNFAHGRHTGFSRRAQRTAVIALSDRESYALASGSLSALPADIDLEHWHVDGQWESAVIALLARSMSFAGKIGEERGLDIARPTVPSFGRRLYHLPLTKRVPVKVAGGVERKLLARGAGDDPELRDLYGAAATRWLSALRQERFAGLVLDYDGTVCWTSRRWQPPGDDVKRALVKLLEGGLVIGFASGRGRSLHVDLRTLLPKPLWPQVLLGMYSGSLLVGLDEEMPAAERSTPWSKEVVAGLDGLVGPHLLIEERGTQVSVRPAPGSLHPRRLASIVSDRLDHLGIHARALTSGHAVDIVEAATDKTRVSDAMARLTRGGGLLAIGDQGQEGGNDYTLLSASPWTLSVDRCSTDLDRCWFAGDGQLQGPDLLVKYLGYLQPRSGGFAVRGLRVS